MKPSQTHNIDNKIDDGKPHIGDLDGQNGNDAPSPGCRDDAGTAYRLTATNVSCRLWFRNGF